MELTLNTGLYSSGAINNIHFDEGHVFDYIFLSFFVIMNMLTLILFRMDKNRAIAGQTDQRIPESRLMKMGLFGGSIGGLIGIYQFRHKSQKTKFKVFFVLFLITHVIAYIGLRMLYFSYILNLL